MRLTVQEVRRRIADERERIREKIQPEIDSMWEEVEARQAQDSAERNALVEVHRERRSRAQATAAARAADPVQEDTTMATNATQTSPTTEAITKKHHAAAAVDNGRSQPGQKKKSSRQRIQNEMSAVTARSKKSATKGMHPGHTTTHALPKNGNGKKTNGKPVAKATTMKNGEHGVVDEHKAEAKKLGVRIKLWKKGSQSGKFTEVFQVYVMGTRHFAISGNIDSLAAAKAAAKAAGFEVKSLPEAAKKK